MLPICLRVIIIGIGFLVLAPSQIWAANLSRDQLIRYELQCVSQRQKSLGWNDVCATDNFIQQQREQQINQALDAYSTPSKKSKTNTPPAPIVREISPEAQQPAENLNIINPSQDYAAIPKPVLKTPVEEIPVNPAATHKKHNFHISPEVFYAYYDEPDLMHQDGVFYGYAGQYTYQPAKNDPLYLPGVFYRVEGHWAQGEMDYSSNGTGSINNKDDYTYEVRGLLGGEVLLDSTNRSPYHISGYSGLGYRYLMDEGEGKYTSTGAFLYDRQQEYYYIPIGLTARVDSAANSSLEANIEFEYMFYGHNQSDLGWQPGYSDLNFDQKNGYGVRSYLNFTKKFKAINLFVEPFLRYWDIAKSDVSSGMIEPENTTSEYGLRLGAKF